jgi:hypothetical protein
VPERVIEEQRLEPGQSTRFGRAFNPVTGRPRLRVKVDVPNHVRGQIECEETLLGKPEEPEKCYLVFSVRNRSSWLAFLTLVEIVEDAKPLQVSS